MNASAVGFVGLGKMGQPMVARLLDAGYTVRIFARSDDVRARLQAQGAIAADSAAEVARGARFVMTALPTPTAVDEVFGEFATVASAGQTFIDHSTVRPEQNRRWAQTLAQRGADYLDAPVSGGPAGASAGTLTVMVGGSQPVFDAAVPVLSAFGKTIRLCGAVGAGQAVKLVNQLLVGVHTAAIAEAAVFGASMGADPQVLLEVIGQSFGGSTMMMRNVPRFIARDFAAATPVDLIIKDLGLIADEAHSHGVELLLGALAERLFLDAHEHGWGSEDMAGLVRLWEEQAGIDAA